MLSSILILLIITTYSITISNGRSLTSSDQLMPSFFSSVIANNKDLISSSYSSENMLLLLTEHIIKYVSKIKSSEDFIDSIINRQKQVMDQLKILKFLNKCFRTTKILIEMEIKSLLDVSNTNTKSLFSLSFTLEDLQQAENKINILLNVIDERMNTLKTWIPPTMPFLNF